MEDRVIDLLERIADTLDAIKRQLSGIEYQIILIESNTSDISDLENKLDELITVIKKL